MEWGRERVREDEGMEVTYSIRTGHSEFDQ